MIGRSAVTLLVALGVSPAFAADLAPGEKAIAAAAAVGARAATGKDVGYPLADHVLYAVRDARGIDPADGDVDAVVVATPLERTRHAAFVAQYTGHPIAAAEAYKTAALPFGHLAVIVYAHGANFEDRDFVGHFSDARLAFDDVTVVALPPKASEPSNSLYPLAEQDRMRFVATLSYTFDLSSVPNAGRRRGHLMFVDASGKPFDLSLDLAKFE